MVTITDLLTALLSRRLSDCLTAATFLSPLIHSANLL